MGVGSRRYVDGLIIAGRVRVNGKVARPGDRISMTDQVSVDRRKIRLKPAQAGAVARAPKVLAYYKPEGEICTVKDPQGRRTVFAGLPKLRRGRWISIGRLDINSSGLLLFTDSGELANYLMHPRNRVEREYAVRVSGRARREQLDALEKGVRLEDGLARFAGIRDAGGKGRNHWYHVVIMEGRNREVTAPVGVTGLIGQPPDPDSFRCLQPAPQQAPGSVLGVEAGGGGCSSLILILTFEQFPLILASLFSKLVNHPL